MKDIPGFEGEYAVTSCGRVWSYKRNKFLKPSKDQRGYLHVHLGNKVLTVHRIVARTYIENPNGLETVDHIDENKENNSINNLRWLDRGENKSRSWSKRVICKETGQIFKSIDDCANQMNLQKSKICLVCKGKRNHTGGFTFSYY